MPKPPIKTAPERKIFISYAHADFDDVKTLHEGVLIPLCKRLPGTNAVWVDYAHIKPGDVWNDEIERAIAQAEVFLVVMTRAYVMSKFCMNEELPRLLARKADGHAKVIGVALKYIDPVNFLCSAADGREFTLADVQCIPSDRQPSNGRPGWGLRFIHDWPKEERDAGWAALEKALEEGLTVQAPVATGTAAPTMAPSLLMSPHAPSASRALRSEWLPYLADRNDQCVALIDGLLAWKQAGFRRPLVVLTEGRDHDCLSRWVERLRSRELPDSLRPDDLSFGETKSLGWPTPASPLGSVEAARHYFARQLARAFGPTALASLEEVIAAYQKRPTLVRAQCQDAADAQHGRTAFAGLLSALQQWPDLERSSLLVVAVNIERERDAAPGGRARLALEFEAELQRVAQQGGVHSILLGSLPELTSDDIDTWAGDLASEQLRDDITLLRAQDLPGDRSSWPMLTFAQQARKWLGGA